MTYKRFHSLRTIIFAFFIAVFLLIGASPRAQADEPLFTIRDVKVDVTAKNALAAREEAFVQAQRKAFAELTDRLANQVGVETYVAPDDITIATMIKDYQVTSEKLSSVRYIGTYTFRFKSDAVRKHFSGSALNYTDLSSPPILILPFFQKEDGYDLWSYKNDWREAWDRINTDNALVPIAVPVGDLQDVKDIGDNDAHHYDPKGLNAMLNRYGAKDAVIAIAIPDAGFKDSDSDSALARGALSVNLYRTNKFGPEHFKQFFITPEGSMTRAQAFDQAVQQVQQTLRTDWKEQTIIANQDVSEITVHIAIASLSDWTEKQKMLSRIGAITQVKVDSLTPRKAIVELSYAGDISRLDMALGQQNYVLRPIEGAAVSTYELISNATNLLSPEEDPAYIQSF